MGQGMMLMCAHALVQTRSYVERDAGWAAGRRSFTYLHVLQEYGPVLEPIKYMNEQ